MWRFVINAISNNPEKSPKQHEIRIVRESVSLSFTFIAILTYKGLGYIQDTFRILSFIQRALSSQA